MLKRTINDFFVEKKKNDQFLLSIFSLLAIGLFAAFFIFCFVIPQTPARLARPSASLFDDFPLWSWIVSLPIPVPTNPHSVALLLIALILITFSIYGLALFLSGKISSQPVSLTLVLLPACAYLSLSVFALPNQNTDIFNYMLRGRLAAVYNKNPYIAAADEIPSDPVYPYAGHNFTDEPEWWKGPLWTSIEIGLAKFTGDNVIQNLIVYRVTFALFNLANLVLIMVLLKKINPRYLYPGLLLYAWNPIVIVLGQGKGDTIIVFFLLLAILWMVYRRRNITILPLALSVLIKWTTLPFVVAYLMRFLNKARWKEYLLLGTLSMITAVIVYTRFNLGNYPALQPIDVMRMAGETAPDFLRSILRGIFIGLILLIGFTRQRDEKQTISGWFLLALFFSLFLVDYGKAWYLMTLIVLACLIPDFLTLSITFVISCWSFLIYNWYSGFNNEFSAPSVISLPSYLVYFVLPLMVLLGSSVFFMKQSLKPKKNDSARTFL